MDKRRRNLAENQQGSPDSLDSEETMELFCRAMVRAAAEEKRREEHRKTLKEPRIIDMTGLFFRLLDHWKCVILVALVCALAGGIYAHCFVTPYYSATAKLYVLGQTETSVDMSALQVGTVLTMDYQEVFRTWEVHEMVREALGLDCSYDQMQSMLTVTNPEDTRILCITVQHSDAQMATDVANAYAEAAKTFILENMDGDAPNLFSVALVPGSAISRSPAIYILRGFLLGAALAAGVIALLFIVDDRPVNPKDVARAAGVPVLAVIPQMHGQKRQDQTG